MTGAFDPPSTLKPQQVAIAMIESGVAKHKTRADVVFLKAVSDLHIAAVMGIAHSYLR